MSVEVKKLGIPGHFPAVFTPFDEYGQINLAIISKYYDFMINNAKAPGVIVLGTTGEAVSLSLNERQLILKEWVSINNKNNKQLKIIAQVGCNAIPDAIELARFAQNIGCDAILCKSPFYYKPINIDGLINTLKPIAFACNKLPFYYYHIPRFTGINSNDWPKVVWPMYKLLTTAENIIPNLVGCKYTGMYEMCSFADVTKILEYKNGKFEVFTARDELVLQNLSTGATSFVGMDQNFLCPLYTKCNQLYFEGKINEAREIQKALIDIVYIERTTTDSGKFVPKYLMKLAGVDCGDGRLPFQRLTEKDKINIKVAIEKWKEKYGHKEFFNAKECDKIISKI